MTTIQLSGLGNHWTKKVTKYKIKVGDIINVGEFPSKSRVTKITKTYMEVFRSYGGYNQKLKLTNLFTPIKEYEKLRDSYIIKDKKDKNYGLDFRFIPLDNQ